MAFPSLDVCRTNRLIRCADPEAYIVALNLRGDAEITQDNRSISLGPCDMTIYDSSRPSRSLARGGTQPRGVAAVLLVPREVVPMPADKIRTLITTRMSGRAGVGALVLHHLVGLVRHAHEYSPADAARLATITVDLLTTLLARELNAEHRLPVETREVALLAGIRRFIQQHLADPGLAPQTVAAAHHISTRTLHRLFDDQDTSVSQFIRGCRLERCRHDLLDPASSSETIHMIATRWGFLDKSHFSRTFRAKYGMSPQRCRQQVTKSLVF
jgi:AraC-like DNA-binding protein